MVGNIFSFDFWGVELSLFILAKIGLDLCCNYPAFFMCLTMLDNTLSSVPTIHTERVCTMYAKTISDDPDTFQQ